MSLWCGWGTTLSIIYLIGVLTEKALERKININDTFVHNKVNKLLLSNDRINLVIMFWLGLGYMDETCVHR